MSDDAEKVAGLVPGGIYGAPDEAADKVKKAGKKAAALQYQMFQEGQAALAPWRQTGQAALGQLGALYGLPSQQQLDKYGRQMERFALSKEAKGIAGEAINKGWSGGGYKAFKKAGLSDSQARRMEEYVRAKRRGEDVNKPGLLNMSRPDMPTASNRDIKDAQKAAFKQFKRTPGYQFQLDQGLKALEGSAYASGNVGGGLMKDLMKYGQGMANQSYSSYVQNLGAMANQGMGAAGQFAQGAQNLGQNVGNIYMAQGQAQAAADINQANMVSNMIGQGISLATGGGFNLGSMMGGGQQSMPYYNPMGASMMSNPMNTVQGDPYSQQRTVWEDQYFA